MTFCLGSYLTYEDVPLLWLLRDIIDESPMLDNDRNNFHSRISEHVSVTGLYQRHFGNDPLGYPDLLPNDDLSKTISAERICNELSPAELGEGESLDVILVPGLLTRLGRCLSRGQKIGLANNLYNLSTRAKSILPLDLFPFVFTENFVHYLQVRVDPSVRRESYSCCLLFLFLLPD